MNSGCVSRFSAVQIPFTFRIYSFSEIIGLSNSATVSAKRRSAAAYSSPAFRDFSGSRSSPARRDLFLPHMYDTDFVSTASVHAFEKGIGQAESIALHLWTAVQNKDFHISVSSETPLNLKIGNSGLAASEAFAVRPFWDQTRHRKLSGQWKDSMDNLMCSGIVEIYRGPST